MFIGSRHGEGKFKENRTELVCVSNSAKWLNPGKPEHLGKVWVVERRWWLPLGKIVSVLKLDNGCCSAAQSYPTLWDPMDCSILGFPVHHLLTLLKLMPIELVMPSNHLVLCHPLLLLPSIFPSIRVFSNESTLAWGGQSIGVSASASVLPMNIQDWFPFRLTGLISLQSKGLSRVFSNNTIQKLSILQCSAFFIVQLSHTYMTTGKTIALTIWTFADKVMSLLFNMLILDNGDQCNN